MISGGAAVLKSDRKLRHWPGVFARFHHPSHRGGFPFNVEQRWPTEISGRKMDCDHRWMKLTLPATMAGLPALSVPAGFGARDRLPIGMQIIGPAQADLAVLQIGHAYELASPWIKRVLPNGGWGVTWFGWFRVWWGSRRVL
ncbi:amidase family protein [Sphingomonas sp.]|jgi:hypothetical protein|uniref:amidase family protein n=1 Tax=Sphingomonas sp. TaxID=28214 RepID=UPI002E10CDB1|nr:amidase family protein [Sphingomonas sp.]